MTTQQFRRAAILGYALVAIITFGHAAAGEDRWEAAHHCTPTGAPCQAGFAPIAGAIAAPLWPLYWSWEMFS